MRFPTDKYVKRIRHPDDRRAFLIQPTKAGATAQRRALALLDTCESEYLKVLTVQSKLSRGSCSPVFPSAEHFRD